MARQIVQQFNHQVKLGESLIKLLLIRFVLLDITVKSLYFRVSVRVSIAKIMDQKLPQRESGTGFQISQAHG